ncbi:MAG: pyruvate, phosphate dikinase [Rickettsiales bacterium]|nr:pyruvate, phosphate dikinase [Rickettsiales bacterium]
MANKIIEKSVYSFSEAEFETQEERRNILGGKAAGLVEMSNLGISVPPGFTISSKLCNEYYKNGRNISTALWHEVEKSFTKIEKTLSKNFGDAHNPLLVSVRSGARVSMPGMMDTILNLGLNDKTVIGLAKLHKNEWFAYDSYRRFIRMYSDTVLKIKSNYFEEVLDFKKQDRGVKFDKDLSLQDLKEIIEDFKMLVKRETGEEFPQDIYLQLKESIKAVFDSWMTARAKTYRKIHSISEEFGTAVTIQAMVFGNMDSNSATGVLFTRNPSTGEKKLFGEYLENAQGEDIVAGVRTPHSIMKLKENMPDIYEQIIQIASRLEHHYRDMQDIEFTVEQGKVWILQTRMGKRNVEAALKIVVDLVDEGIIDVKEGLKRINPADLDQLLHPVLDPKFKKNVFVKGLPASPGAASGLVVFSAEEAERMASLGNKVILVRSETNPEDIHGMHVAQGILTSRGGMTSHAAVVARGMGKACIVGAGSLNIDYKKKVMHIAACDDVVKEHDSITIDGQSGEVMLGDVPTIKPVFSESFHSVMKWAEDVRKLKVLTNAETPEDIKTALNFGAEGIGLCRTEHMFFDPQRIISVRKMIIADSVEQRKKALNEILPMQREDFIKIFQLMKEKPVNIRLLDPPLHEFIPKGEQEIKQVAISGNTSVETVMHRCKQIQEINPMLGHRGCRLAITYPEIYEMQVRAIFEAMCEVSKQGDIRPNVEIMMPLIVNEKEIEILRDLVSNVAKKIAEEKNITPVYKIGTMIELPRAALCSDKIAPFVEYMSYGTNDLSQTTFGFSRDDAAMFISHYVENGIFKQDPFVEIDKEAVGELMKISVARARSVRKEIKLGVCGEHAGDPASIKFFSDLGCDYISCSPYRIQIAKLAAAQGVL